MGGAESFECAADPPRPSGAERFRDPPPSTLPIAALPALAAYRLPMTSSCSHAGRIRRWLGAVRAATVNGPRVVASRYQKEAETGRFASIFTRPSDMELAWPWPRSGTPPAPGVRPAPLHSGVGHGTRQRAAGTLSVPDPHTTDHDEDLDAEAAATWKASRRCARPSQAAEEARHENCPAPRATGQRRGRQRSSGPSPLAKAGCSRRSRSNRRAC